MEVVHECCAGLDVHKKSVFACVRKLEKGGKVTKQVRSFGTMTRDILKLAEWMAAEGVTHVAMESTGVFWKPIYNILEGQFEILLCNAQHIKQVPGRKTDVKDCEWIAQLLQHGLLRGSFVPPRPLRELRDLTRHRAQLCGEKTRVANRVQKVLEDANIKLGSVASDVLGVSGRDMLRALVEGEEDAGALAELARRRLREKIPQLRVALEGRFTEHHRFMLRMLLEHLNYLEKAIADFDARIEALMKAQQQQAEGEDGGTVLPFAQAVELLTEIPGINRCTAENIVAETGTDMGQFPTAGHLAKWAGMCPGNNQTGGKHKSTHTGKGNRWLRRALSQAAWAAGRTKKTYLSAQFRRLASRRGKKRAVIAVGHTLLVIVFHMLKKGAHYQDLGAEHFDRLNPSRVTRYLVKRLESLGYKVQLQGGYIAA